MLLLPAVLDEVGDYYVIPMEVPTPKMKSSPPLRAGGILNL
jgi:hypothetical protein